MSKIFYSASTRGFYIEGAHRHIPQDAEEITPERHQELVKQRALSNRWIVSEDSQSRQAAASLADQSQKELMARHRRDQLLEASDKYLIADFPQRLDELTAWLQYRDALRKIPEQPGFPETIEWPARPHLPKKRQAGDAF